MSAMKQCSCDMPCPVSIAIHFRAKAVTQAIDTAVVRQVPYNDKCCPDKWRYVQPNNTSYCRPFVAKAMPRQRPGTVRGGNGDIAYLLMCSIFISGDPGVLCLRLCFTVVDIFPLPCAPPVPCVVPAVHGIKATDAVH